MLDLPSSPIISAHFLIQGLPNCQGQKSWGPEAQLSEFLLSTDVQLKMLYVLLVSLEQTGTREKAMFLHRHYSYIS